jgi:hypothetical protein
MRRIAGTLILAAALVLPQAVQAQDTIPRALNSQETLKFMPSGGLTTVASFDNVYVGPYKADITSGSPTLPNMTLYCVDFANGIGYNQIWTVDVTSIGTGASDAAVGGTMGNTRLGNNPGVSLDNYRQAAFLASLFSSWSSYTSLTYNYGGTQTFNNQTKVWSGIHGAIWSIMTAGYPTTAVNNIALANAMSSTFIGLAATALASGFTGQYAMDFDQWSVLTDVTTPGVQEYLVQTVTPQVVPEPETYVLLFSGLILLWAVSRKRRLSGAAGVSV